MAAIARKDLLGVARNRGVRTPLIVAPLVILVVLPVALVGGGELLASGSPLLEVPGAPVDRISPEVQTSLTGVAGPERWSVFVLEFLLAPLYLLVPLMVATVIAADSFAGERERRTLEALLHTPASDVELLLGKILAAWLPAVGVGLAGFGVYTVVANAVAWPSLGRIFFPTAMWVMLALWVTPAIAALGLGVMVLVSSRVNSLQAAHQIGALVVLPILLLVIGQVGGVLFLSPGLVTLLGLVLWLAAALLLRHGARTFRRDLLASRL